MSAGGFKVYDALKAGLAEGNSDLSSSKTFVYWLHASVPPTWLLEEASHRGLNVLHVPIMPLFGSVVGLNAVAKSQWVDDVHQSLRVATSTAAF